MSAAAIVRLTFVIREFWLTLNTDSAGYGRLRAAKMEIATDEDLAQRKLVRLAPAARTLGVKTPFLRVLMKQHGIPIIETSERGRNILLPHLDYLITQLARKDAND